MVAWQSVQPRMPWTLAACLAGSSEMLLPLADVIPGWPWQARQLSSCGRGWGGFACARARVVDNAPVRRKQTEMNKIKFGHLTTSAARDARFGKFNLPLVIPASYLIHTYFIPRSVRTLGFSSPAAWT